MIRLHITLTGLLALLLLLSLFLETAKAFADTPFYQGKTITVIQSAEPGGSGDLRTRAVTAPLSKYIPGHPTIMMQYMPGGGGLKAANYMYKTARPDGLTVRSEEHTSELQSLRHLVC